MKLVPFLLLIAGCVAVCSSSIIPETQAAGWFGRDYVTAEHDLTIDAGDLDRLTVKTHNGHIGAMGYDDVDQIQVHVSIKVGAKSEREAERAMDALEIISESSAGEHTLGYDWTKRKKMSWSAQVSFDIKLPRSMAVYAKTHNGGIKLGRIDAHAEAHTHNGGIEIVEQAGDLDATTHNGSITFESVTAALDVHTHNGKIRGDLSGAESINGKVTTHNGSIRIELGSDASTEISASTHNSRISIDREARVLTKSRGRIEVEIGSGDGRLRLKTHNGSITVI